MQSFLFNLDSLELLREVEVSVYDIVEDIVYYEWGSSKNFMTLEGGV